MRAVGATKRLVLATLLVATCAPTQCFALVASSSRSSTAPAAHTTLSPQNQQEYGSVSEILSRAEGYLAVGAPEAALEWYRRAQRLDPDNREAALGLMQSRHLATVLSDAIIAGEEHPIDWGPVRQAIAALRDGSVRVHNPSFKVHAQTGVCVLDMLSSGTKKPLLLRSDCDGGGVCCV